MFRKSSRIPTFLKNKHNGYPTTASEIVEPQESWIAVWPSELAIVSNTGDWQVYEWFEIEAASWDSALRELTIAFVDPAIETLRVRFAADANEQLLTMVHERVERSIVCRNYVDLPSGSMAYGQIRRRADESLFVQILVSAQPTQADMKEIAKLESELRDMVGLDF
ncbi:hypothetical protein [Arcanobacterium phocae]|uniref:Uncharacterized protein n=1 Tax=Arcanobacterium phocae TaxID=131112 RepID=A0A1H2LLB6_9ACTO|nr:hypothetical protein [Arcanobacterium phocae]SDU81545.1 hypothetical protein SAMN04489737_1547 [Arcanobacterium phocae]